MLSDLLKVFIRLPEKDEVAGNLPKCFKNYSNCIMVLDCTVQKSRCLKCRLRSYSFYKKDHTIKFLIGVAPSGLITFVSKAYGGRASDKAIFNNENVISKLIPGRDALMVDRGFLIDKECEDNYIRLIRPPFLGRGRSQFTKEEAEITADIARARVHIERKIQRLKLFAIKKIEFHGHYYRSWMTKW